MAFDPTYIYKIVDPRHNEPFYVGQTTQPRERFNCHNSNKKGLLGQKVMDIKKSGQKLLFVLVEKVPHGSNSGLREKFWIEKLRSQGFHLLNKWSKSGAKPAKYDIQYDCEQ